MTVAVSVEADCKLSDENPVRRPLPIQQLDDIQTTRVFIYVNNLKLNQKTIYNDAIGKSKGKVNVDLYSALS